MRSRSGAELPQLELECLAALWALERAPAARVHARLAERGRPLAYTTVLTVLERLLRKRAVERRKQGRAYVYAPLITRAEMRERALERLVGNYFASRQELSDYLRNDLSNDLSNGLRDDWGGAAASRTAPTAPVEEPTGLLD